MKIEIWSAKIAIKMIFGNSCQRIADLPGTNPRNFSEKTKEKLFRLKPTRFFKDIH